MSTSARSRSGLGDMDAVWFARLICAELHLDADLAHVDLEMDGSVIVSLRIGGRPVSAEHLAELKAAGLVRFGPADFPPPQELAAREKMH